MKQFILFLLFSTAASSFASENVFKENKFLVKYCSQCHSQKKVKGKINFDAALSQDQIISVFEVLENGDMPPEDEPQPSAVLKNEFKNLLLNYGQNRKPFRWVMNREFREMSENIFGVKINSSLPNRELNRFGIPDASFDIKHINEVYFEKLSNDIDKLLSTVYKGELKETTWVPDKIISNAGIAEIFPLDNSFIISSTNIKQGLQPQWHAPHDGQYEISFSG